MKVKKLTYAVVDLLNRRMENREYPTREHVVFSEGLIAGEIFHEAGMVILAEDFLDESCFRGSGFSV